MQNHTDIMGLAGNRVELVTDASQRRQLPVDVVVVDVIDDANRLVWRGAGMTGGLQAADRQQQPGEVVDSHHSGLYANIDPTLALAMDNV